MEARLSTQLTPPSLVPNLLRSDPHFKTWTGDKFDFHGECDLVLLQNPEFSSGLGMHVHIRTKLQGPRFSSVETAALRIGEDTLEVQSGDDGFLVEYKKVRKGNKAARVQHYTRRR